MCHFTPFIYNYTPSVWFDHLLRLPLMKVKVQDMINVSCTSPDHTVYVTGHSTTLGRRFRATVLLSLGPSYCLLLFHFMCMSIYLSFVIYSLYAL